MLSKEKCILAIKQWGKATANFSNIKKIIDPTAIFNFSQDDCDWIKNNNNNSNFHVYVGVHNEQLILIVIPIDKDGKEINLSTYLTTGLTNLTKDITLIETVVVSTVTKTTLSDQLEIKKHWKEVDLPINKEPIISERASVKDIEKWKNECLDWFFYECNESHGKNIFRTFMVPFADLARQDEQQGEVVALFGFKYSSIYKKQIPLLIFVTIADETGDASILRVNNNKTYDTNTRDWSHPCPPMCKNKSEYILLDD